jgi:hypothetical protein
MWISKKEYNELVRSRDFWSEQYDQVVAHRLALLRDYDSALTSNNALKSENEKLLAQVEEYKQKYADEVQKRLELVKLIENTT